MGYELIIKTGAELDIAEALDWYEEQREGLGIELLEVIDAEMTRIERDPEHFQMRYRDFKIVFTKRFPYGIHYTIEKKKIFVHAVMKTSRKPRN